MIDPLFVIRATIRWRALAWAIAIWSCFACAAASTGALGFDFDEVMMLAMGFAGLAYVIADLKRERRLDQIAVEIGERIGALESATASHNPHSIAERVAMIEAERATFDPAELRERVASLDARVDVVERIATLEARADHKPITQTRSRGKFASPTALADEVETLRARVRELEGTKDR